MSSKGSITETIMAVRATLEATLADAGWRVLTAETPFHKWNILYSNRAAGICVVSWKSDSSENQAGHDLITRPRISVTIAARILLGDHALGQLANQVSHDRPALLEMHDRVKGALLTMEIPMSARANDVEKTLYYSGATTLNTPDGFPVDAIEQTWECILCETFAPDPCCGGADNDENETEENNQ